MTEITHATDATFEALVLNADRPVLVDFWAEWCGPCKMMAPEIQKIADQYADRLSVVKLDTEANQQVSMRFNIMSIPTLALFRPGKEPVGVIGFQTADQLAARLALGELPVAVPA